MPQKLVWNIKEVLFRETLYFSPQFPEGAGVTAAASAMAAAVPQASAGFLTGKDAAVTILYTNDVHTYIDNKSPKLTYAAIAAMKQATWMRASPSCWWTQATIFRVLPTAPWTTALPSSS